RWPDRRLHRHAAPAVRARAVRRSDGREGGSRRAGDHAVLTSRAGTEVSERKALLGLGSNVGERRGHLQAAADALQAAGVRVLASSSTYDTDPVGEVLEQPSFLNACLLVGTELEPLELLDTVKRLE